jgi:hypothetical protein
MMLPGSTFEGLACTMMADFQGVMHHNWAREASIDQEIAPGGLNARAGRGGGDRHQSIPSALLLRLISAMF